MQTQLRVDELEVKRNVGAGLDKVTQCLTVVDILHLQEIHDTKNDSFVTQALLYLRELEDD